MGTGTMSNDNGLVCAYVFDGEGGGRDVGWDQIMAWQPSQGVLWVHLDRTDFAARKWLRDQDDLDPNVIEALLAKGSRPRTMTSDDGLLVFLRGVNLNPGEDPFDTVSARIFASARRIISVRRQHLSAIEDIRAQLADGNGPRDAGDFLVTIADRLTQRMAPVLGELADELDRLEDQMLATDGSISKTRLADLRRDAITLRRFLAPQREALANLQVAQVDWVTSAQRRRTREVNENVTRYVENLDAAGQRAAVVHDQIADLLAEQMNRAMYMLSMVAAIFLPLDFLTGLLGVNLRGIPGADNPWSFVVVAAGLFALAVLMVVVLRRLKWLRPLQRSNGR
jgi:zinc transporter